VSLTAGAVTVTRRLVVTGDPAMPVTQGQYRAREAFLMTLLGVQRRTFALAHPARGKADSAAMRLERRAYGLAAAFNGRGAVQGTLSPPTPAQRRELAALETELARLRAP